MRGTQNKGFNMKLRNRITPAHAGNTMAFMLEEAED